MKALLRFTLVCLAVYAAYQGLVAYAISEIRI